MSEEPFELFEKVGGNLNCYYDDNICQVEKTNLKFALNEENKFKLKQLIIKTPRDKIKDILPQNKNQIEDTKLFEIGGIDLIIRKYPNYRIETARLKSTTNSVSDYPQNPNAIGISICTLEK